MKKRGLGQGLGALLGDEVTSERIWQENGVKDVFSIQLVPSSFQPREFFDNDEIDSLAASIRSNGILQPILVRKKSDNVYEIIAGERRWRAAQRIGLEVVPVIEKNLTDEEALTIALVENIQREDLNPIEEAQAYERIMEKGRYTQEKISELVGKSRGHVSNILRLTHLPEKVKEYVKTGKLTMGHAKVLLGTDQMESVADLVVQKQLNVRQTEKLLQKLKDVGTGIHRPEKEDVTLQKQHHDNFMEVLLYTDEEALRVQSFIEDVMKCKTTVQIKGENNITIAFHLKSMDDLDRFMAKINNTFI